MPIVAVDDTDSREDGMCTTYVATLLADALRADGGCIESRLLVRLNPAVKHKTRGNAAVALHVSDLSAADVFALAREIVSDTAIPDAPRTSPGVVVADIGVSPSGEYGSAWERVVKSIPGDVADFTTRALRERLSVSEAVAIAESNEFLHAAIDPPADTGSVDGSSAADVIGRGRIGALAAVGAPAAFGEWTTEVISYREFRRCGTPRRVDEDSVFTAEAEEYPIVWDTVDRGIGTVVCVPNAPGPILHGIRGDDVAACRRVASRIESEPVDRRAIFRTNQGTDAHLASGRIGALRDGAGYRVDGVVVSDPVTKRGGHVHIDIASVTGCTDADADGPERNRSLRCVAFAPTGRFRDHVRTLRRGDRVTCCGECEVRGLEDGPGRWTLKLEKFAVRDLVRSESVTPNCPDCGRTMSSAGRDQGYRCRDCGRSAPGRVEQPLERELNHGWYEVPPAARRHVAKPLVRGGFDAPVHPER